VSDVHRLVCGCSYIRVPGQYVGTAVPTVDVLSVCHDHGPNKTPKRGGVGAPAASRPEAVPGSRRPGDVAPALQHRDTGAGDAESCPCPSRGLGPIPARVAIPGSTPTTTLPQHTTAFAWPSSEGAGPSLVDDYYDAGGA